MEHNTVKNKNGGEKFLNTLTAISMVIITVFRKLFIYLFNIVATLFLIGVITGGIVATVFAIFIRDNIDASFDLSSYVATLNQTSTIYYTEYDDIERTNGTVKEFGDVKTSENRIWATVDETENSDEVLVIPEHVVNAYIAVEDKRFYDHSGVDWFRTGSAVINLATKFNKSYGGSTITQQLIKNLTGDDETTIQRKLQEILRALYLERNLEAQYADSEDPKYEAKKKIIETYLNTIFLSQKAYGVQAASQTYFSKNVSVLSIVEGAALAAIPQNPYKWNPASFPENNKERRNEVLSKMRAQNMITEEEYREAINTELVITLKETDSSSNSYFTDYMISCIVRDLKDKYGYSASIAEQMVTGGGLQIYSTVDPRIQTILEEEYCNDSNFPTIGDGIQPQSAMVIMDPYTSRLLAMVGGRGEKKGSVLNRAVNSKRQPGSTIKPLAAYCLAIDKKVFTWGSVFDDSPYECRANGTTWPRNASRKYSGLITLKKGLQNSINTVAVKIVAKLGPQTSFDFLTKDLGITTLADGYQSSSGAYLTDIGLAPMALGGLTFGASLIEWANAYCIFPNDGLYTDCSTYTKVCDKNGNVILSNEVPEQRSVISSQTATIMNLLLKNVVNNGTARSATLRTKIEVAGKTGTTDENKDLWFVGYTPYLLGGTWFGFDTPKKLTGYTTNPALIAWNKIMLRVHNEVIFPDINSGKSSMKKFKTVKQTGGIVECEYCIDSGMLPCAACKNDIRGTDRIEKGYFIKGTEPTKTCNVHVEVLYDKVTKSVACSNCPQENLTKVSLIKVDREYPFYVAIGDAQYTYRDVGTNFKYAGRVDQPFYYGLKTLKVSNRKGYYYGLANTIKEPANRICTQHLFQ